MSPDGANVYVASGHDSGALQTSFGSVAILKRVGAEIRLIAIEGAETPRHNGAPIPADGATLTPGDKFEVAGTELTLVRR